MADKRRRESLYPKRIAGISFSEVVYDGVQEVRASRDLSEAQVIRGTVAKGLGAYTGDLDLFARIEQAATELGTTESEVVRGALEKGLEEFLFMERGRKFHEQNAGKQLSGNVLRRLLMSVDKLYTADEKESLLRGLDDDPDRRKLIEKGGVYVDSSAFCRTCGQYVRADERGSEWDKRLADLARTQLRVQHEC